jgi:ribonuclease HI
MNDYIAWFDGACEPVNPGGTASFGVVIKGQDGTVLLRDAGVVGKGKAMSNNLAEHAGVLNILIYLSSRPPGRVTIRGDSNLVINQLDGKWRIKKGLYLAIVIETKDLLAHLRGLGWQINFCWIPRDQNEECDALSRRDPSGISIPKCEHIRKPEVEAGLELKHEPSLTMYPNALKFP